MKHKHVQLKVLSQILFRHIFGKNSKYFKQWEDKEETEDWKFKDNQSKILLLLYNISWKNHTISEWRPYTCKLLVLKVKLQVITQSGDCKL